MSEHQVVEAQSRLLLVLRSLHGPRLPQVWNRACTRARVLGSGQLTLDELDRVCLVLTEDGGSDAVAARSCRVRLLFLRRATASTTRGTTRPVLDDESVRAAFAEPEALDEQAWLRRLAALEAEVTSGSR